ncbi:MAG: cellulose synthase family protein [Rhodothermaceae bacterium]
MNLFIISLYTIAMAIIFVYSLHALYLVYLRKKYNSLTPQHCKDYQFTEKVTIQLPVYNELYVVDRLINKVCNIDYPQHLLEIQVLDDSTDETTNLIKKIVEEKKLSGINITHIHRTDRIGYKAGALNHGLQKASGDFIAVFDADFLPEKDFLKKTLPCFTNANIGMVQTRWEYINEDYSLVTKAQALALDGHFVIEQTARNRAGLFINFNGTGGVWKKECILDAGNWQHDTITEDLDLSYRAQMRGWKFVFISDVTCPSELPAEINSLKSQQFRWTKGAIETAKKILPQLWKSELPARIKLFSTLHLTCNIVFPLVLLIALLNLPLMLIKIEESYTHLFSVMLIFSPAFLISFYFYLVAQKTISPDWKKKIILFPLFMAGNMGLSVNNTRAVVEGLFNKKTPFIRTPKFSIKNKNDSWQKNKYISEYSVNLYTVIELLIALYCLAGVAASLYFYEIATLPFQLMFFFGFTAVAVLSIKHSGKKKKQGE